MNKMRRIDVIEIIANELKELMNKERIALRFDHDDDQWLKIELGRKLGRKFYKIQRELSKARIE